MNPEDIEDPKPLEEDEDQEHRTLKAYSEYAYADAQSIPSGVSTLKGTTQLPDGIYDILDLHLPHLHFPDGFIVQDGHFEAPVKNVTAFPVTFFQDQKIGRMCHLDVDWATKNLDGKETQCTPLTEEEDPFVNMCLAREEIGRAHV